jgi:EAL domain-containing protein (putative c-di-GMP-specific phosphodiesterase class I)/GGDEF domain-containing protein
LKQELKKENEYTLILISIDNLNDINARYGIKNGDKIVYQIAKYISEYFQDKSIHNFPMGHIKGGDFIIGLKGKKSQYSTVVELFCLKNNELKVDDIEVNISSSITDTYFSNELDYMIENLFQYQEKNRNKKIIIKDESINPSELESFVINAIKNKSFLLMAQKVFENDESVMKECFTKLKTPTRKLIHQKNYMNVINRLGLTIDFDLMILEKTISFCSDINSEIFALSISPTSLRNPIFLTKIRELINNKSSIRNKIMFILSEQEYYSHIEKFNTLLNTLRDMGILIMIDKLGSLHTSFLYLRDLDIDVVRFDSLLTKEMKKRNNSSIIKGFHVMAQANGIKTWIKMIESEDIKIEAQKLGINYLQGRYLSEVEKFYES